MANTLAREYARARHMTRRTMEEYLRDLGRDAADLEAALICLDAGITPAELAEDAESIPELAPVAAALAELVAVP